jgi:arylsulfatase A-like enzyme
MTQASGGVQANGAGTGRRAIVMIMDGLRPDEITPATTPNLDAMARAGVRFTDSHAVFPTVTRANSSSITTGLLPARHGIRSNMFYAPDAVEGGRLNTGDHRHLESLRRLRGGRVLRAEALGERVHRAGGRTAVVSTGSPGSALLQHPQVAECGDVLVNPALQVGIELAAVEAKLGPVPAKLVPNTAQNAYFTRIITEVLLPEVGPRLIHFWHTDPDATQHALGVGHPTTMAAIRAADANLGTILAALERLGLADETDVIVTSDHGFCSFSGELDLRAELVRAGLQSEERDGVVVIGEQIYVRAGGAERVAAIVALLARLEAVGPIFTGARGAPVLPGTLDLAAIGADGDYTPDIVFSKTWTSQPNEHGYPGTTWSMMAPAANAASHGTMALWDIRNTLIAAGPDFKRGLTSDVPAGAIDVAPTLLHVMGLPQPEGLDGRVLGEALVEGPAPSAVVVERSELRAEADGYQQTVRFSTVGETRYLDFGTAERT